MNLEKLQFKYDLAKSSYIKGDYSHYTCSIAEGKAIIGTRLNNRMLVIDKWEITRSVKAPEDLTISKELLLPGFDLKTYPFVVIYGRDTYQLVNLNTLHRDALILGSASNFWKQTAIFFLKQPTGRFFMNFCTTRVNDEKKWEHNWYKMQFNVDFIKTLSDHGRLPFASNDEAMNILKEHEIQKLTIDDLNNKMNEKEIEI